MNMLTSEELISLLSTKKLSDACEAKNKKETEKPLTEENFWNIVDKMNYRKDLNYKRIRENMDKFEYGDNNTMNEFKNMFNKMYSRLENKMDELLQENDYDYEDTIGLGDDGLSDLISHIIGIGKKDYYKCLNDINEISEHANRSFDSVSGYSESFQYIFN